MGVTTEYIRGEIEDGKLQAERLPGGSYRIYVDEFIAYLRRIGWKRVPKRRG
jgi:excisionase family DNA binding protein